MPALASPAFQRALSLWRSSRHTVVLTGAGSSTPSGIPDFRSVGSGLWTRFLPMEVASLTAFQRQPERFFEWLRPLAHHMLTAEPNAAHLALAEAERKGKVQAIITQNIDGLHQRAGSRHVLEVHGTLSTMTCMGCYQQYASDPFVPDYLEHGTIPRCPACGQILKPDAILFEEQLPATTWVAARQQASRCDLMIVLGSSLMVMPVAGLPLKAVENGARLIIINKTATYLDERADAVLHADVAEIVPALTRELTS
ncbi:MAG: NAD-dependent deacylase [Anaerolineae bacterium]|nr:MAG: NAD-dependent deacylase [Anaerolineae bacterium]